MSTFKLLAFAPHPNDGTSNYRMAPQLARLRKISNIEMVMPAAQFNWTDMVQLDGVFLQRAFTPAQIQVAQMAKTYNKPIILDYDDNLLNVQIDNPTSDAYNSPQSKQAVEQISRMADAIIVSTDALKSVMQAFNPNVYVVPNALDMSYLKRVSEDIPLNPVVCWRGGHTHVMDLMEHTDAIMEAYEKFPDWSFAFFGYQPFWIMPKMSPTRARYIPFSNDYPSYMANLQKMRAAIQMIPLADNNFNHCKSRVGHLESSFAGSVCLGPDWKEWQGGELERYNSKESFRDKLFKLMETPLPDLLAKNNRDWAWIKERFTLDVVNRQRLEVFKKHMPGVQ